MPKTSTDHLTQQQARWFASVRDGLERETGKSLSDWVAIARTCPETRPRARLAWFKAEHGLLQNRASYVISQAFPAETGWDTPEALRDALWTDPAQRAIFEAVEARILALPEVIAGQRKGYSAFSRKHQFAALRPVRGGVRLGLAVAPQVGPRLEFASKNEGWSERLKAAVILTGPAEATPALAALVRQAWDAS